MFNKLLNLYTRNTSKTPLEDFTTELLVGVLNNDKKLQLAFCHDFLNLKSQRFKIYSQQKYYLKNYSDCIIDIVIKGDNEICFIENKVNSKEGLLQLERYAEVLDKYVEKGKKTKLVYCTKNSDIKKIKSHSFLQFKWRNIAEFFKHNSSEKMTSLFINYLKLNNMSNDMTINAADIITLENMSKMLNLMNVNLENVKHAFSEKFGNINDLRQKTELKKQIFQHERFCIRSNPAIEGVGWSEILFGFEFQGYLFTLIFLENKNKNFDFFLKKINDQRIMKVEHYDFGSRIYLEKNLGDFLNNEYSENEITEWFEKSFVSINEFMESTKNEIEWSKYVKKHSAFGR